VPLNIAPIEDWRSDSEARGVNARISWGKILAIRERALDVMGHPLRFVPASLSEVVRLWYQMGGAPQHITRDPLLLVRLSHTGLAPLILLSLVALNEMADRPELADRLKLAIEQAVTWIQIREERGAEPNSTALLLLDSGTAFPIARTLRDTLDDTPPPFHCIPPELPRKYRITGS
jgi:hypothetical protein